MSGMQFLGLATVISLGVLSLAFVLTIYRIARGPSLPDRILGLDMLVSIGIGYIAVLAIKTGFSLYLDVAIALGLVGFLATVAFARYVHHRGVQISQLGSKPEEVE
ncbi:Na(+) H(+) antiporter subunit F [hydrothermal vent metagenome]|uniref:Na(+) H(+) antiporter subunit F n=1 Tax=hydrothermal vent metagenome TaxID=652676 RepID=A0A3B0T8G9_9ZZZZ